MQEGIKSRASTRGVDELVTALSRIIEEKGATFFTVVDHSGAAAAAGLAMPNTKLLIFGNARIGTPLMVASPETALDLPLKILVAEQRDGSSLLSWNDPAWLQSRHGFPLEMVSSLLAAERFVGLVAE